MRIVTKKELNRASPFIQQYRSSIDAIDEQMYGSQVWSQGKIFFLSNQERPKGVIEGNLIYILVYNIDLYISIDRYRYTFLIIIYIILKEGNEIVKFMMCLREKHLVSLQIFQPPMVTNHILFTLIFLFFNTYYK